MRSEPGSPARLAYNYVSSLRKVTRSMLGLATCPTCNFPLAPNAVACPRCGRPVGAAQPNAEFGIQNAESAAPRPPPPAASGPAALADVSAEILAASSPASA